MITPPVEEILEKVRVLAPHEKASLIEALQAPEEPPVPRVSIRGKYKGYFSSVDEFLRMKHEDNERDDPETR